MQDFSQKADRLRDGRIGSKGRQLSERHCKCNESASLDKWRAIGKGIFIHEGSAGSEGIQGLDKVTD